LIRKQRKKEKLQMSIRKVRKISQSVPTMEGAGVRLRRAFGFGDTDETDPFLLLDDFRGDNPDDYIRGFPWHPHRGIETITYVLTGDVAHGDSLGHKGDIGAGDVQWMTAGSGIIHQEMPRGDGQGRMWGFQLWANLPAKDKMIHPKYRDVTSRDIPEVSPVEGVTVKIIAGEVAGVAGPVRDVVIEPEYLDVLMRAGSTFSHSVPEGHTVLAYVHDGTGQFGENSKSASDHDLVIFGPGSEVTVSAEDTGVRFLLISGKPLREPVAWRGPIVMNTDEELYIAFEEYQNGTFLKHG
jgi:redox-sensitive bicupin YhaK (pirin superfamily)